MVGTFHKKKEKKDGKRGMAKLATMFVDWSSRCHGNHSRFVIQRKGLVNPVTQSTKDGSTPKDVTNAASTHHLLICMLYQTHMNE